MLKEPKYTGATLTDLQRLSAKRNYHACFQINSMLGHLLRMQGEWPGLDVTRANVELERLRRELDKLWQEQKAAIISRKTKARRR